jgi:hypothetical protein
MHRPFKGRRLARAVRLAAVVVLRVLRLSFILMLLVIPLPVVEIFRRVFPERRRAVPTQVHRVDAAASQGDEQGEHE